MTSSLPKCPQSLDEVDITSPDAFVQHGYPYPHWAFLREHAPVYWYERPGIEPFWAITKYDDIQRISRDPKTFSNKTDIAIRADPGEINQTSSTQTNHLLQMDPPEHAEYRSLVNRRFTPRGLSILEDRIDEISADIVDRVAAELVNDISRRGQAEFVSDVSARMPLTAICELLGVPRDRWEDIHVWTNETIGASDPEFQKGRTRRETARAGAQALFVYFMQLAEQKRRQPADDLMTTLVQAELHGEPLNAIDLLSYAFILILGGNETTRNATSGGLLALIENPDQMQLLRSDRSLIDSAVEEILRWTSPIIHFGRLVTEDVEIAEQSIAAGEKVVMWYPSGNRDEDIFDEPDQFLVGRDPNEHIAFGGFGEHFCLGANLARLELRSIFNHVLDRLDDIQLDGDVERLRSGFVGGIKHLPISFSAV
ncbi:MAG: cytochrome P450 [Chloroflexi bacterium]|nr:cytochrome P450 [Chloroflexota bacterium]